MAGSVNKAIILGNVGADPEIRTTQSGSRIATFSMATSESWKDKATGEKKENTQWHRIVVFNDALVTVVENYIKKGSKLYVEGQIETRKWTDQNGIDRYTTEITLRPFNGEIALLDRKEGNGPPPHDGERSSRTVDPQAPSQAQSSYNDFLDDDIPF